MQHSRFLPALVVVSLATAAFAARPGAPIPVETTRIAGSAQVWHDARSIGLEGVGFADTATSYSRLPARAKGSVPGPVWGLAQNTAGLAVRFVTDSTTISAYWDGYREFFMNHMAPTGSAGLDLYARQGSEWVYRGTGKPQDKFTSAVLARNLGPKPTEYLLFLPLYHNVTELRLGLDATATLSAAPARKKKPVVFYGTSITQGGCASRAGMCHVALLGRWLDREMINLGFSGSGKGEPEMAELVSEIDAGAFVLEPLPNMTLEQVRERIEPWVRRIRERHPSAPILLVENPLYARDRPQNAALRTAFGNLRRAGVKKLHLLRADTQLAGKENGTVDGIHPTDLGFLRMAEAYLPVMREMLAGAQ